MTMTDFGCVREAFEVLLEAVNRAMRPRSRCAATSSEAQPASALDVYRDSESQRRLESAVESAKRAFSEYQDDLDSLLSRLPPPAGETPPTSVGDRGEATLPGPTRHCRCGRHLEQHDSSSHRIYWCPACGSLDFDDIIYYAGSPPSPPSAWAQAGELLGAFRRELDAAGNTGELIMSVGRDTFTYHVRMSSDDCITTWNWTFSHLELKLAVNLDSIAVVVVRRWREL